MSAGGVMSPCARANRHRLCGVSTCIGIGVFWRPFVRRHLVEDGTVGIEPPPAECGSDVAAAEEEQRHVPPAGHGDYRADHQGKAHGADITHHVHGGKQRGHVPAAHVDGDGVARRPSGAGEKRPGANEDDSEVFVLHGIRQQNQQRAQQKRDNRHALARGAAASSAAIDGVDDRAPDEAADEQWDLGYQRE